eukprot:scaffold54054_cov15-Prasinocladus_malaysianus.AAC.1
MADTLAAARLLSLDDMAKLDVSPAAAHAEATGMVSARVDLKHSAQSADLTASLTTKPTIHICLHGIGWILPYMNGPFHFR